MMAMADPSVVVLLAIVKVRPTPLADITGVINDMVHNNIAVVAWMASLATM